MIDMMPMFDDLNKMKTVTRCSNIPKVEQKVLFAVQEALDNGKCWKPIIT